MIKLRHLIKEFNILKLCKSNLPKQEITYTYLGFFIIISTYSAFYIVQKEVLKCYTNIKDNINICNFICNTVLIFSTIFLTYPLWPKRLKKEGFILFVWPIGIFYTLVFVGSLLVIFSKFNEFQLMIFMLNIIIVTILLRWNIALIIVITGIFTSVEFYKNYMGVDSIPGADNLSLEIIYVLILFSSIVIMFLKPRQAEQEIMEARNTHLGTRIHDREEEIGKLLDLKYEFLRNINHEIHTPMTGITSLGETLWARYDQLNDKQRRQAAEIIAISSKRLNSFVNNILDFSKLSSLSYNLNKQVLNLSLLLHQRISICQKLYLNNKALDFVINIEDSIILNFDRYYIKQTLDNLIINAITYSQNGTITISLKKTKLGIKFAIQNNATGVPQEELQDIFGAFVVSSKTRTPAGGRGMGLTLCKKVIEVHGGKIWAENDEYNRTFFLFTLPL